MKNEITREELLESFYTPEQERKTILQELIENLERELDQEKTLDLAVTLAEMVNEHEDEIKDFGRLDRYLLLIRQAYIAGFIRATDTQIEALHETIRELLEA